MLTGAHKPHLTLLVYFTAIYFAICCHTTSAALTHSPSLLWFAALGFYAVVVGLDRHQRKNYELLP
jgi:hypothetical protein